MNKSILILFSLLSISFCKTTVTLFNAAVPGTEMPIIGIGTGSYGDPGNISPEYWDDVVTEKAITEFLSVGGRRVDTSTDYYTSQIGVGRAIAKSTIPRKDLFITSKVGPGRPMGYEDTLRQVDEILQQLQTNYVDLILIHWPGTYDGSPPTNWPCCCYTNTTFKQCRIDSWKALEEAFQTGKAKAIGVSNFEINHLQDIIDLKGLLPSVNQIEFNPYWHEDSLLKFCQNYNITFNGYSSVGTPDYMKMYWPTQIIEQSVIVKIAAKYKKTPAQIVLNWSIQLGLVANARTWDVQHMKENLDVFDFNLTSEEMMEIANVPKPTGRVKISADPHHIP